MVGDRLNVEQWRRIEEYKARRDERYWDKERFTILMSPSDVGVHNMLRTELGLKYIDFEHAGIDEISKLLADWITQL